MVAILVAPKTSAQRCAACHDRLAGDLVVCRVCRTALHADCRSALRRCPSLGCSGRFVETPSVRLVSAPEREEVSGVRGAPWTAAVPGLIFTAMLWGAISSEAWSAAWFLGIAHVFGTAIFTCLFARRRFRDEPAREGIVSPALVAFTLQFICLAPIALATFALTVKGLGGLAHAICYLGLAFEPAVAGKLAAIATNPARRR